METFSTHENSCVRHAGLSHSLCSCGLHLLPIVFVILLPTTFLTSDIGALAPESCVFGEGLNFCAVLVGFIVYVRYQEIKEHPCCKDNPHIQSLSKLSLVLGIISAIGIGLVGNFQEQVLTVHIIASMMAFTIGGIYAWVQTYVSYHTAPQMNSNYTFVLRLVLCCVISIAFIMMNVGSHFSFKMKPPHLNERKWRPEDAGYAWHLVSTIPEWILAFSNVAYFATFINDFRQLSFVGPKFIVSSRNQKEK